MTFGGFKMIWSAWWKLYLFLFSRSIIVTLEDEQTPEVICIGRIHSRHGLSVWDGLSVGKFASARKKKEDLSPIYTTEKKGSHKKVGTDQIFLPCKPSVPCFHEMDPDLLFSGLGAIGGYGPKTPQKRVRTPFAVRKRCVNACSFRTIFFMWACRALRWFRACLLLHYFTIQPNLIVTRVHG